MSSIKIIFALVVCLCSVFCIAAFSLAESEDGEVREVIIRLGEELASDPSLPGLSIAVLKKGKNEPVSIAFGSACIENNVSMSTSKKIKIGSVTKVFTAALIHKLIEDKMLKYDTTIERFFPKFPNAEKITIGNLLNHTSGVIDMLSLEAVRENMAKKWSPEALIEMVGAEPLSFSPGAQQKYSNTGYLMLALISEIVSGRSYEEQIQDVFHEKLGMESLYVGQDEAIVPQLSCGYTERAGIGLGLPIAASIAIAKGTGNLVGSPSDVVRLVNIDRVLQNNVFDTVELAPLRFEDGERATFTRKNEDCEYTASFLDGCTLFMFKNPEITLVGKLGSFPGFGTVFFYDQETKFAVAISVNNERAVHKAITLAAKILHELRS